MYSGTANLASKFSSQNAINNRFKIFSLIIIKKIMIIAVKKTFWDAAPVFSL